MNYFSGCTDLKSAKKVYIDLVKKHHPDKGGSERVMQEINHQFDTFKKGGKPGSSRQRHKFSQDDYADAFRYAYGFDWGAFDFESMRQTFYKARGKQAGPKEAKFSKEYAGEWSEDFEAKANKKAQQDAEELKARMEKLKEDIERKKEEEAKYRYLYEFINQIVLQNIVNCKLGKMEQQMSYEFISLKDVIRGVKGNDE